MASGIPCIWMRGGTSKGAYFLASDLPLDPAQRDALLLAVMGSPDPRQIDGIGGGDPLTSKVAILAPPSRGDADVDYLFLQVFVDRPLVSAAQPCGNILAGVGPAAIELGLVRAQDGVTPVRIHMLNTAEIATAEVQTPKRAVSYHGETLIDGVPRASAAISLYFENSAGSVCGALLPSGQAVDQIDGIACTLIDHGMPLVLMEAAAFGLTGYESPEALEANATLCARIEAIRLKAGPMMRLGEVRESSVPKMTLIAPPREGGVLATRSFIPHRVHSSIGVLAAVSVAAAAYLPQGPAARLARLPESGRHLIEHPTGAAEVLLDRNPDGTFRAGTLRSARKLFQGKVFP